MTTLAVNRRFDDSKPRRVVIPVSKATDAEFEAFFAEQLRELLHRHGIPADTLSDAGLITRTVRTFTPHGRIVNR